MWTDVDSRRESVPATWSPDQRLGCEDHCKVSKHVDPNSDNVFCNELKICYLSFGRLGLGAKKKLEDVMTQNSKLEM